MRRCKLRTGLTSATLTLLTFVMICFTSTQNGLVDKTLTVGRAEYQGLLTKHDEFLPMTDSESFAVKSNFIMFNGVRTTIRDGYGIKE